MKESRVEEIHQNLEEQEQEKLKKKTVNKTPRRTKWFVGLGYVIMLFYFYQKSDFQKKDIIFIGIITVALYFLLNMDSELIQRPMTEREAKAALFSCLKWKQVNPYDDEYEIPSEAKIKITGPAVLRNLEGKPWRWELGYRIIHPSGLNDSYSADMDAYTPYILGIKERRKGFSGNESPDIRYIKSPKLSQEKRYDEALGRVVRRT